MSTQEPRRSPTVWPGRWILGRDVLSFVLGWGVAIWEVSGEGRDSVLLFCAGVVGVPALINGGQTVVAALAGRSGTGSQSEPSPQGQPSP